jgi:hypothetical protein
MALSAASLKFYRSLVWSDANGNGTGIDTGTEITTATSQNIFPNITNAERITGVTKYKKVFFRNENADAYNGTKAWIATNTPSADTAVTISGAGSVSTQGTDTVVPTLTFTFAASTTVVASADCHLALSVGERIFNSTNDTNTAARVISAISADGLTITLASAYAGTTGAAKAATVCAASGNTFVTAVDEANGVSLGNLTNNQSIGVWVKLVVGATASGYTDDTFTLTFTNS